MRFAFLWPEMSGYMRAAFNALEARGHEILLAYRRPRPNAPFVDDFGHRAVEIGWDTDPPAALVDEVRSFAPHAVLMPGWHTRGYRRVLKGMRGRTLRVCCMDNVWHGSPKQWLGRATHGFYIQPLFDAAWVPTMRAGRFARMLGISEDAIWAGLWTADVASFVRPVEAAWPTNARSFLFVGRLVPEKGVDVLADAYEIYRREAEDPWPLIAAGVGPLAARLEKAGADLRGFVQPGDLPTLMHNSGALVLPSRFEPWGLVVHEAAAAGLIVIATPAVGAAETFLEPDVNGLLVDAGDVAGLTDALAGVSGLSASQRAAMSSRSAVLAQRQTPELWARTLEREVLQRCRP